MRNLLILVLVGWAVAFVGSFFAFWLTEPDDMGFTKGVNRLGVLLMWQMAAVVLAFCAVLMRRRVTGPLRRLALVPAAMCLLMLVGFGALIGYLTIISGA